MERTLTKPADPTSLARWKRSYRAEPLLRGWRNGLNSKVYGSAMKLDPGKYNILPVGGSNPPCQGWPAGWGTALQKWAGGPGGQRVQEIAASCTLGLFTGA